MREKASSLLMIENFEKCLKFADQEIHEKIVMKILMLQSEVEEIDVLISNLTSARNVKKTKEHFLALTNAGNFSIPKMWSLKRKLNLNGKSGDIPSAKKDNAGNLITSKAGLLSLYQNTYMERLAPKKAREEYETLQESKEALFANRYLIASLRQSPDWNCKEIEKVCKSLKNSKARDDGDGL